MQLLTFKSWGKEEIIGFEADENVQYGVSCVVSTLKKSKLTTLLKVK